MITRVCMCACVLVCVFVYAMMCCGAIRHMHRLAQTNTYVCVSVC